MRYFQAVCRNMSFTKAAEESYISQPAVSATIRELEDEFGIRLFNRHNNNLSLTEEGKWLLGKCDALLQEFDGIETQLQLFSNQHNYLRLGVAPMIENYYFFSTLNDYIKRHPAAKIEVMEAGSLKLREAVLNNTIDVGVVILDDLALHKFHTRKMYDCELVFCVDKAHPFAHRESITFADLSREKIVLFKEDSYQNKLIKAKFKEARAELNVVLYSNQLSSVKKMLHQDNCGAFLFKKAAEEDPDLVAVSFRPPILLEIGLIWLKNQKLYADMQNFISYVSQTLV